MPLPRRFGPERAYAMACSFEITPTSLVRSTKMRLRVSNLSHSSRLGMNSSRNFLSCGMKLSGRSYLSAHPRVRRGETRSSQQLEKVIKFLALGECVQKDRHRAQIEGHRADTKQM